MTVGSIKILRAMIKADPTCVAVSAEADDFYYCPDPESWTKGSGLVGDGQCVSLVKAAAGLPPTAQWVRGPVVKNNSAVPKGTIIATFDPNGSYPSHKTGNHAAIFIQFDGEKGIQVIDQWQNKKDPAHPSLRTIRYRGCNGSPSNDGDRFSVVLTANQICIPK
jgi:hypothetical protein